MERMTMKIDGMTCGHCVSQVTKALKELDGVTLEQVSMGAATVSFDPTVTPTEKITQAVEHVGYAVATATR